ncbi:hypothetical protein TRIUR3_15339 [Triticum urartu]|uniref:Pectin acetylesterase n=2 Tax=Triticum TaxID=4564 RepID=A0A9R0UYM8_TRITD|nr:hypothetical protein TRIUR3_15339 [Triticum urartu]VAH06082.1 unnamed protein product [Triticum turgidum subsp. durum]
MANSSSWSYKGDDEPHICIRPLPQLLSSVIYMRGQRIWDAIIADLLTKGLAKAKKVLLSGCSAGGLATFFHCDDLGELLGGVATGAEKNLNKDCLNSTLSPYLCFFPQYALQNIKTPYFILNSAYDVYQFHHIFVPPSSDPRGHWSRCLRSAMLTALKPFEGEPEMGMFINSCFAHCQSELQDTWFAPNSPTLDNEVLIIDEVKLYACGLLVMHGVFMKIILEFQTIAELVGDWYFERGAAQEIDCAYPCDSTCHNIIPSNQVGI